jgi:hypothetical protein
VSYTQSAEESEKCECGHTKGIHSMNHGACPLFECSCDSFRPNSSETPKSSPSAQQGEGKLWDNEAYQKGLAMGHKNNEFRESNLFERIKVLEEALADSNFDRNLAQTERDALKSKLSKLERVAEAAKSADACAHKLMRHNVLGSDVYRCAAAFRQYLEDALAALSQPAKGE